MTRKALLTTLALTACLALAFTGCDRLRRKPEDPLKNMRLVHRQTLTRRIPAQDIKTLTVREPRGAVTISFTGDPVFTINATKVVKAKSKDNAAKHIGDYDVHSSAKNGALNVYGQYPDGFAEQFEARTTFVIQAPRGTAVTVQGGSGAVTVTAGAGAVTVKTGIGPVKLTGATGSVRVETDSAPIFVDRCHGTAVVESMSGDITLLADRPPNGDITLKSGSGNIVARVPDSSDLTMDVTAADADTAFAGLPPDPAFAAPHHATHATRALNKGTHKLRIHAGSGLALIKSAPRDLHDAGQQE